MTTNQTAQPSSSTLPLEYDFASMTYHTRWDPGGDSTPSTVIVEAIETIENRESSDVPVTLYDCIDPDALDALFAPLVDGTPRATGRVEFTFDTYRVRVHANGRIAIRSRQS